MYRYATLEPCCGGSINETWKVSARGQDTLFLKLGAVDGEDMYRREFQGLKALGQAGGLRVPEPLLVKRLRHCAVLVMEFICLSPVRQPHKALGVALAELHGIEGGRFGYQEDNFIGCSYQKNEWKDDWWDFFCQNRLAVQLQMAKSNGMGGAVIESVLDIIMRVPARFADHRPSPSLLHGDLWTGNTACDEAGRPVVYDPAIYYGDSETDMAMSQMFGSLPTSSYEAYYCHRPARDEAALRKPIYDLYHWLNHFNIFGATYLGSVEQTVKQIRKTL